VSASFLFILIGELYMESVSNIKISQLSDEKLRELLAVTMHFYEARDEEGFRDVVRGVDEIFLAKLELEPNLQSYLLNIKKLSLTTLKVFQATMKKMMVADADRNCYSTSPQQWLVRADDGTGERLFLAQYYATGELDEEYMEERIEFRMREVGPEEL
jgi:hypothetical protein